MQKGEFVRINYRGIIKETGEVFDEGKSIPIVVGEGFVIRGLDEEIEKMNVGEKKKVELPPEKAFGKRRPELIKVFPLSAFREHNLDPKPGIVVNIDGVLGRIVSVSSGRVTVDFNHPLTGKHIIYEVEVLSKIEGGEEKAKALVEYFFGEKEKFSVEIDKESVKVYIEKPVPENDKRAISEMMKKFVGVKEVIFLEKQ